MSIADTINTVFPQFMAIYMSIVFTKCFPERRPTDSVLFDICCLLIGCCLSVLLLFGVFGGLVWLIAKTLTLCGAPDIFNWTAVKGLIMLWGTFSNLYKLLKKD